MLLENEQSQLVLVDYQTRLMAVMHESEFVQTNALRLARAASLLQVPVILTEQNSGKLGETFEELRSVVLAKGARLLDKMHFSALPAGLVDLLSPQPSPAPGNARSLPKHLQKNTVQEPGRRNVVLAGCEAHICLLQTALDLLDEEFDVAVVTDACSSRTERNRDAAFDRLAAAGVELVTTEMLLFEWLRTAEHAAFREIQKLIK
jgi:nicotinamidase-related amidase